MKKFHVLDIIFTDKNYENFHAKLIYFHANIIVITIICNSINASSVYEKKISGLQVDNGNLGLKGKFRYVYAVIQFSGLSINQRLPKLDMPTINSIK